MTERTARQMSQIEHVKTRPSVYIGSPVPELLNMWYYDIEKGKFEYTHKCIAPGFLKIIDEIIVNAIDQHTYFPEVNNIIIDLNDDGVITIYNDGRGFNLKTKTQTVSGEEVWIPELCAGFMLSGDNYDDDQERITGGTNGIGMKATNIFSKKFAIVTQDGTRQFKQLFFDNLSRKENPVVKELPELKNFTKISFLPDYAAFKHEYTEEFHKTIKSVLMTRAIQTAAFTQIYVRACGEQIEKLSFDKFCKMHIDEEKLATTIVNRASDELKNYPIRLGFTVGNRDNQSVLVVNGVFHSKGGTVVDHFRLRIYNDMKNMMMEWFEKTYGVLEGMKIDDDHFRKRVRSKMFIFVMCNVDKPQFESQSKMELKTPRNHFNNYIPDEKFVKKCWEILKPSIALIFDSLIRKKLTSPSTKKLNNINGYEPARIKKNRTRASLFVVEGLSAAGPLSNAISESKKTGLSNEFFGIFPIRGVPLNAIKKVSDDKDTDGKSSANDLRKVLQNERFAELVQIVGLNAMSTYDTTPAGDEEFAKLKYGQIILVTDQDLDGHNICGLFCANLLCFWPNLIKRNFIKKLNTPILRARWEKNVKEFYSINDYNEWSKTAGPHTVKYYKGLGSNDVKESLHMYTNVSNKLIKLSLEDDTFETFNSYYGKESDIRKQILIQPQLEKSVTVETTMTEFLKSNVHEYQRYNVTRKIPSIYDGNTLAKRKAIYASLKEFKTKGAEIKVIQLTGAVIKHSAYHHGDASMSDTIIGMAQTFRGGKVMPFYIPKGQVGSSKKGGKDKASPRYVSVALNEELVKLNYPKDDEYILDYNLEEGDRHEPVTYYTLVPNAIMEYIQIPGTGWSTKVFPRNYVEVMDCLIGLLEGKITEVPHLPIYNYNKSEIVYAEDGSEYASVGSYIWRNPEFQITKMPLYMYSSPHAARIGKTAGDPKDKKKEEIKTYENIDFYSELPKDSSTNDYTDLTFYFNKKGSDFVENLKKPDWGLDFFKLRRYLKPNLNFIGDAGNICEFQNYEQAFIYWFNGRKKMFAKRIHRQLIVLRMQILKLENQIRFLKNISEFGDISKIQEKILADMLEEKGYPRLNTGVIANPGFIPVTEIEKECYNGGTYNYITRMSISQLTKDGCEKCEKEKNKLEKELAFLIEDTEPGFEGRKMWLRDVLKIKKILDDNIPRYWGV